MQEEHSSRRNSKCKGSEAGMCLACSRNSPEASVAGAGNQLGKKERWGGRTNPLCIWSNLKISEHIFALPTRCSSEPHYLRYVCGILVPSPCRDLILSNGLSTVFLSWPSCNRNWTSYFIP